MAMQEELNQFKRNDVWFKNKHDEHGIVTQNNARLVAKGHAQIEWIDFEETFAPLLLDWCPLGFF